MNETANIAMKEEPMLKRLLLTAVLIAALAASACSDRRAEELLDTARLEELQNSPDHARSLYREIMEKYPDTTYAAEARSRLEALAGKTAE